MKTYKNVDKSLWPRGDWDNEPDKAYWVDEATGLDCRIVRNEAGGLCGYVGVPKGHPFFEKSYDDLNEEDINVHGGLTYSGKSQDKEMDYLLPPQGDSTNNIWWLGFDCAHYGDLLPKHESDLASLSFVFDPLGFMGSSMHGTYRNFDYVKSEVESLALQIKKAPINVEAHQVW